MTDRETIESMLYELATPQKMGSFFVNNATSDFLFIRPSGNPINAKGFEEMMSSGDVFRKKQKLQKFISLNFSLLMWQCVFLHLGQNSLTKELLMMICQLLPPSSKRLMGFGKFIGCKDQRAILICHYGTSK